jgi:hypothetical protein
MLKPWIALAGAGALLSACASAPHPTTAALGGAAAAATSCAAPGDCQKQDLGKRQYYDEQAHRYYYYDGASGRYYWEDGAQRD